MQIGVPEDLHPKQCPTDQHDTGQRIALDPAARKMCLFYFGLLCDPEFCI